RRLQFHPELCEKTVELRIHDPIPSMSHRSLSRSEGSERRSRNNDREKRSREKHGGIPRDRTKAPKPKVRNHRKRGPCSRALFPKAAGACSRQRFIHHSALEEGEGHHWESEGVRPLRSERTLWHCNSRGDGSWMCARG